MEKKLRRPEHKALLELVKQMRTDAGLNQQELANRVGEPQSFVSKYESGERRLDILELKQVLDALQVPFLKFAKLLELRLKHGKYPKKNSKRPTKNKSKTFTE